MDSDNMWSFVFIGSLYLSNVEHWRDVSTWTFYFASKGIC